MSVQLETVWIPSIFQGGEISLVGDNPGNLLTVCVVRSFLSGPIAVPSAVAPPAPEEPLSLFSSKARPEDSLLWQECYYLENAEGISTIRIPVSEKQRVVALVLSFSGFAPGEIFPQSVVDANDPITALVGLGYDETDLRNFLKGL